MRCDNQFCIYWDSGLCLLTAISLDAQGACRDCVEITLPECHPESGPFRLQKGGRKGREPVVSGNPHGTGKYGSYMSRGRRRFRPASLFCRFTDRDARRFPPQGSPMPLGAPR